MCLRILILVLFCAGCRKGPYDQPVTWTFADGRACAESGTAQMVIFVVDHSERGPQTARCSEGSGGQSLSVRQVFSDDVLEVQALSLQGGLLYVGNAQVEDPSQELAVVLRYVGGR